MLKHRTNGVESRLLMHSEKQGECLLWTASTYPNGYGKMNIKGISCLVHRVAYEFHFGEIPDSLEIHHTCENKTCINPKHLMITTRKQHLMFHEYPRDELGRFIPHEK